MSNENDRSMKEDIADVLREMVGDRAADDFLGQGGMASIEFGNYVKVFVSEKFGGEVFEAGVNWSAIGTVGSKETREMGQQLTLAAKLVEEIEKVIDGVAEYKDTN